MQWAMPQISRCSRGAAGQGKATKIGRSLKAQRKVQAAALSATESPKARGDSELRA